MNRSNIPIPDASRVELGHYDSVRTHVRQQVCDEVRKLERRIETLKLTQAPHAEIIISAYERMIERKRGFLQNWDM
ncbi:MAG: hypothetical protein GYB26_04190 [Gammaproteobacteria bacterium]|uniref:Uncharacterized protein n=1 Tax=Marinobacter litoralis TaxID=187981 RepID=A0A3M2RCT9_9GAMM|nr:hypothetical protein [Marinobacter litoralis]MBR9870317.1 hypothetical protein [Gammaproteobacteria bacterium]RMJ02825.1 hypothetical protein DOQ08_02289 [Marinobacter litoralis]